MMVKVAGKDLIEAMVSETMESIDSDVSLDNENYHEEFKNLEVSPLLIIEHLDRWQIPLFKGQLDEKQNFYHINIYCEDILFPTNWYFFDLFKRREDGCEYYVMINRKNDCWDLLKAFSKYREDIVHILIFSKQSELFFTFITESDVGHFNLVRILLGPKNLQTA